VTVSWLKPSLDGVTNAGLHGTVTDNAGDEEWTFIDPNESQYIGNFIGVRLIHWPKYVAIGLNNTTSFGEDPVPFG
jgi:hypothetical protein